MTDRKRRRALRSVKWPLGRLRLASLWTLIALCCAAGAPAAASASESTDLLGRVQEILSRHFYDPKVRELVPGLVAEARRRLEPGAGEERQREVAFEMLQQIDVSHLGLLSKSTHKRMFDELWRRRHPTVGFELLHVEGDYYVINVLEGGPAEESGLPEGVRVLTLSGELPASSGLLDFRTDDAALPDPPQHYVVAELGDCVMVEFEDAAADADVQSVEVCADDYSAFEAFRSSAGVREIEGRRVAYVHLWYVHMAGVVPTLERFFRDDFAEAEALVFDLRGRGGSAAVVERILALFGEGLLWNKPLVVVVDGRSRSAKDVLAYEFRERGLGVLVGERTAGAVIPAMFSEVGEDTYLMFPARTLGAYTALLEGVGVEPHVAVEQSARPEPGDPILDRAFEVAVEWLEGRFEPPTLGLEE